MAARFATAHEAVALVSPRSDPRHLLTWLDQNPADVLVLDERWLHDLEAATPNPLASWPGLLVLLVGDRECTALAEEVVANRFHGFLLAKSAADTCVKAVRTVRRGEMWIPRALLVNLLFEHVHATGRGRFAVGPDTNLTPREAQIIRYVRRGFANKQIAESLAIREDTVKKHLRNAYTKLGVHRRSELITNAADRVVRG